MVSDDATKQVFDALWDRKLAQLEANTRDLCQRLEIDYAPPDDAAKCVLMWGRIGYALALQTPEFKRKKRGRPKISPFLSKDVLTAELFDGLRAISLREGKPLTDREIAEIIKACPEDLKNIGYMDVSMTSVQTLAEQASRGRGKLAK